MYFSTVRFLTVTLILLPCLMLLSGCDNTQSMAQIVRISGSVEARTKASEQFVAAVQHSFLPTGGAIRTKPESGADLLLAEDRGIIAIKSDTYFELPLSGKNARQDSGTIIYRIDKDKGSFSIETPHGLTGVLGTTFELSVSSDTTTVGVKEGKVSLTNHQGETRVVNADQKLAVNASGTFGEITVFDLKTDGFKYIKQNEKWVPLQE